MKLIIGKSVIETSEELQNEFKLYGRDNYPPAVYDALLDLITECYEHESPFFEFDLIAWDCDITWSELSDFKFETLQELEDYLQDRTTILYVANDEDRIYHFVY